MPTSLILPPLSKHEFFKTLFFLKAGYQTLMPQTVIFAP
jgi:hypothetical protein